MYKGNKIDTDNALISCENIFQNAFENSAIGMALVGREGYYQEVNVSFCRIIGYSREELLQKNIRDITHKDDIKNDLQFMDSLYRGERETIVREKRYYHRNGQIVYVRLRLSIVRDTNGNFLYFLKQLENITEKKLLEKIIGKEQQRFEKLFNEVPVSMCIMKGINHTYTYVNKQYFILTGRDQSIIGKTVREVFPEVEEQGYFKWLDKVYQEGKTFRSDESSLFLDVSGQGNLQEIFISFICQPYYNSDGRVEGIFYLGVDVTEQVLARRKIEESQKWFRIIFEQAAVGVAMIESKTGRIIKVNKKYTEIFGYSAEELLKMTFMDFSFPDDLGEDLRLMNKLLKGEIDEFVMQKRHYHKNGSIIWTELSVSPMWNTGEKPNYHIAILKDITEQKLIYEELVRKEHQIRNFASYLNRMLEDDRTRMARELHDEMGQQLTGLKMSLSSVLNFTGEKAQRERVAEILSGVENMINSLRKFSNELRPAILDTLGLAPSIEWLVKEFEKSSKISCELKILVENQSFDKELSTVYFRICQEALNNIAKHSGASQAWILLYENKNSLLLEVKDNGKGIDEEKSRDPLSMGMIGMRERASMIHADLSVKNINNSGTFVRLHKTFNNTVNIKS